MADFHAAERASIETGGDPLSDPLSGLLTGTSAPPAAPVHQATEPSKPEEPTLPPKPSRPPAAGLGGAIGQGGGGSNSVGAGTSKGLFDEPEARPSKPRADYGGLFGDSGATSAGGPAKDGGSLFGGKGGAPSGSSKGEGLFGGPSSGGEGLFGDASVRPKALFDEAGVKVAGVASKKPTAEAASMEKGDEPQAEGGVKMEDEAGPAGPAGPSSQSSLKALDPSKLKFKSKKAAVVKNEDRSQPVAAAGGSVNDRLGLGVDFSSMADVRMPAQNKEVWKQSGLEVSEEDGLFSGSGETAPAVAEAVLLAEGAKPTGQGRSTLLTGANEEEGDESAEEGKIDDLMVGKILEREESAPDADELFGTSNVKQIHQRGQELLGADAKDKSEAADLLKDETLLGPDTLLKDLEAAALDLGDGPSQASALPGDGGTTAGGTSDEDLFSMIGGSSTGDIVGDASQFDFSSYIKSQGSDEVSGSVGGLFS